MFQSTVWRLTLWYILLIMLLSMAFSGILYRLSTIELDRLERRQQTFIEHNPTAANDPRFRELSKTRGQQIRESKQTILLELGVFNLVVLTLSGGLSYLLAKRTLQPIEQSLERQKRFTADTSHELRTPITAMKTELEVALRAPTLSIDETKILLASTLEEVEHLELLSARLLQLAKQESASPESTKTTHHLSALIKTAEHQLAEQAKTRHIVIETNVGREQVIGDDTALVELLVALLDNAIKYSPEHETVHLTSTSTGRQLKLAITDHGVGIKSTDLPHIFDRFYRADQARSQQHITGYGLGLAIAKQIAEANGGNIIVTSTPGHGSTFTVQLPKATP